MFGGFGALFSIMFFLAIGLVLFTIIRGITQWNRNNQSPRLTVGALVAAKREDVSHHMQDTGNGVMQTYMDTSYYATFQFESGDRLEFLIPGAEYGRLAEGDSGYLTFQGTRYLGFERT
jgi:Protein of unknown function (DUF2500).